MSEQKMKIIEVFGNALAGMTENQESYLMGFLEGTAAMANNQRTAPTPPAAPARERNP